MNMGTHETTAYAGESRASDVVLRVFGVIACVALAYLAYRQFIMPIVWHEDYSESMMLGMAAAYVILLAIAVVVIRHLPERALAVAAVLMLAGFAIVQVYLVHEMQLRPADDISFIMDQAIDMVESGEHFFTDRSHFRTYTNNIPIAMIVYWVYRAAHALGSTSYEWAGGLFNAIMNTLTYVCAYRIARRYCSRRTAVLFLFLLVSNPTLYAYAGYYYTDTVSMSLTLIAVDLYTAGAARERARWQRYVLMALGGYVLLFANKVRVTSLFILIAAVVLEVLRGRWRDLARKAVPVAAGILVGMLCYGALSAYHIDFDTRTYALPVQHYLVYGANMESGGRYTGEDEAAALSQGDHDAIAAYATEKWIARVRENGVLGNLSLILGKEANTWSYGCRQYFQYVNLVKEKNPVYEWIIGEHQEYFRHYMNAQNLVLLLLMLVSTAWSFVRGRRSERQNVLLIYWLGALLFYVFWEVLPRQSVSYTTMMTMMIIPLCARVCDEACTKEGIRANSDQ